MKLLGLYILIDGKCHYAHQQSNFVNEHLITGLLSALTMFYNEIYEDQLQFMQLNDVSIKMTKVDQFDILMMYNGKEEEAEMYLCRVLEEICINQMIDPHIDRINKEQEQTFIQLVTEISGETAPYKL